MMQIKVGFLIAYDFEFLKQSLPTVYDNADTITLAIDKERKTFAGEVFEIPSSFFDWLREFDRQKKITIYEDNFFVDGMPTRDTEVRERNMLAKAMGEGGWHIQIDVDEYFIDFAAVVKSLHDAEKKYAGRKITFRLHWNTIFKIIPEGYFLIDDSYEAFALATNNPVYEQARYNHSNENIPLPHLVLHQSWGRTEDDLKKKLRNWSHNVDFDTEAFFEFWQSINLYNYKYITNFHPLYPEYWKKLKFVKASSIEELTTGIPATLPKKEIKSEHKLRKWLPPVVFNRLVKQ